MSDMGAKPVPATYTPVVDKPVTPTFPNIDTTTPNTTPPTTVDPTDKNKQNNGVPTYINGEEHGPYITHLLVNQTLQNQNTTTPQTTQPTTSTLQTKDDDNPTQLTTNSTTPPTHPHTRHRLDS